MCSPWGATDWLCGSRAVPATAQPSLSPDPGRAPKRPGPSSVCIAMGGLAFWLWKDTIACHDGPVCLVLPVYVDGFFMRLTDPT